MSLGPLARDFYKGGFDSTVWLFMNLAKVSGERCKIPQPGPEAKPWP